MRDAALRRLYEGALSSHQPLPTPEAICAKLPPLTAEQRLELVLIDQHFRWQHQQAVRAEEYFERFTDIAASPALAARVVIEEFGYLQAAGQSPTASGFLRRFPHLTSQLQLNLASLGQPSPSGHSSCDSPAAETKTSDSLGELWSESRPTSSAGTVIGPYRTQHLLGRGAFGEVWLAERRGALAITSVALKLPRSSARLIEMVKAEAQTWVRASGHPNIVPILDADIYDGRVVIASEYVAGGSLQDLIRSHAQRPLAPLAAIDIVTGILVGLEHLHGRGIIHRDLKPANVLLQGGFARLTDFGLSRLIGATSSEQIGGTPAYMAPEAFNGERTTTTDLWSVAVMLFQLLTGHLPFPSERFLDLVRAISDPEPVALPGALPAALAAFLSRALGKLPRERFQSAAEMRSQLAACRRALESGDANLDAGDGPYQAIAVTGSMHADPSTVRLRLAAKLRPYFGRRTSWYLGTWGVVDEVAAELLSAQQQNLLLVGYQAGDISPPMGELIRRFDLPFIDPAGLTAAGNRRTRQAPAGPNFDLAAAPDWVDSGGLRQRDAYFLGMADLIVLAWDGVSRGTRALLDDVVRARKEHLVVFV